MNGIYHLLNTRKWKTKHPLKNSNSSLIKSKREERAEKSSAILFQARPWLSALLSACVVHLDIYKSAGKSARGMEKQQPLSFGGCAPPSAVVQTRLCACFSAAGKTEKIATGWNAI